MADLQGIVEYGNVQSILGCSVTLSHGITPSQFVIRCLPQEQSLWVESDLRLKFGSVYIRFQNCLADEANSQFDSSGQTISMTILDRRWKWRGPTISGHYNMRGPDGKPLKVPEGVSDDKFDPELAVSDGQREPRKLMEYCLDALGEKNYFIDAPGGIFPEVHWEEDSAAQALQEVCDYCGCRIVLTLNNTISIVRTGKGAPLPPGPGEHYGQLIDPADMPAELEVVFEPSWFQMDLALYPVAQQRDGKVVVLDDVDYAPANGWGETDDREFDTIEGEDDRQLAKQCVYRWYQVQFHEFAPEPLPDAFIDYASQFDIVGVQVFTHKVAGQVHHRPAVVFGDWYDEEADQNTSVLAVLLTNGAYSINRTIVPFGFTIDDRWKVVKFDSPLFLRESESASPGIAPADIKLRTAVQFRSQETAGYVRYKKNFKLAAPANTGGQERAKWTRVVPVEGLRAYYHDPDDSEPKNQKELDEHAEKLKAEIDRSYRQQLGETAIYSGWLPISPDGALQSITWNLDAGGATTTVNRNNDPGSDTTLSYAMRRLNEQFVIAANAAVQMDKQRKYPRGKDGRFDGELPPMRGGGLG